MRIKLYPKTHLKKSQVLGTNPNNLSNNNPYTVHTFYGQCWKYFQVFHNAKFRTEISRSLEKLSATPIDSFELINESFSLNKMLQYFIEIFCLNINCQPVQKVT